MRKVIWIIVLVILLLLGATVALVKFNVLGLGYKAGDMLGYETPVIKYILPEKPEEEKPEDDYAFETVEDALENLEFTEQMLKESKEKADKLSEEVERLNAEIDRLKRFEEQQLLFEEDKAAFDEYIATSFDKNDYVVWFEKMYPENAKEMYSKLGKEVAIEENQKDIVAMYEEMKPKQAAAILEQTIKVNADEVLMILKNISEKKAAAILSNMEPTTASRITTYMYEENVQ